MNLFEELERKGFVLAEAFRAFNDAMADLKSEHPGESLGDVLETEEESLECEDFPMRKYFNFWDLNPNDPRFLSGFDIGLPEEVTVHTSNEQNKLYPIINGLFKSKAY